MALLQDGISKVAQHANKKEGFAKGDCPKAVKANHNLNSFAASGLSY